MRMVATREGSQERRGHQRNDARTVRRGSEYLQMGGCVLERE